MSLTDGIKFLPVLYVDGGVESETAEIALQSAHIDYQRILITDPVREETRVPRLLAKEGFFDTVDSIQWYAKIYGRKG